MRLVVCACVALAALSGAAPAGAISIARTGAILRVTASPGERNDLYIESGTNGFIPAGADRIVVRDAFNCMTVGDGCRSPRSVRQTASPGSRSPQATGTTA
jgi:hypothetical protein